MTRLPPVCRLLLPSHGSLVNLTSWLKLTSGPGLYTSPLASTTTPEVVSKPSLVPYPPAPGSAQPSFNRSTAAPDATPVPISVAISQWHWILLYTDRIVGIARETEKVVFEERISLVSSMRSASFR